MSKPTERQKAIIDAMMRELEYWTTSNDIHSPSHGTSIDFEMFANMDDPNEKHLVTICHMVGDIHGVICDIDPCPMREEQRKKFQP